MGLTESVWSAILGVAWATKGTWGRRIVAHVRIQPIHVHQDVIPHADDQDHATIQSLSHLLHATNLREAVAIAKSLLLVGTGLISLDVLVVETFGIRVMDFGRSGRRIAQFQPTLRLEHGT